MSTRQSLLAFPLDKFEITIHATAVCNMSMIHTRRNSKVSQIGHDIASDTFRLVAWNVESKKVAVTSRYGIVGRVDESNLLARIVNQVFHETLASFAARACITVITTARHFANLACFHYSWAETMCRVSRQHWFICKRRGWQGRVKEKREGETRRKRGSY